MTDADTIRHVTPRETMGELFDVWSEPTGRAIEVLPRTWQICPGVVNVTAIETDDGLVLVDTGMRHNGDDLQRLVRSVTDAPLHTVIYTHAHIDHAFGHGPLMDERPDHLPRIVAHRATIDRFRRYISDAEWNTTINARQSGGPKTWWPRHVDDVFWPDVVYDEELVLTIGGEEFRLRHARGETDDATWVSVPSRQLVCVGDLWLGVCPNAGNPQKVQRYAADWADAFDEIVATEPAVLVPGHSTAVHGVDEIRSRLGNAAELLRHLVHHALEGMRAGLRPDAIVASLEIPRHLTDLPYLRPLHDRPEFIVQNVLRLHGGWWNGYAADLSPAPRERVAGELVALAGGADALAERAGLLAATDLQLACHLAEIAALGDPTSEAAHRCVETVFTERFARETSFMARGVYRSAAQAAHDALVELSAGSGE